MAILGMAERERRANELMGSYSVKTAGGLMFSPLRRVWDGGFYANTTLLLFFADEPLVGLPPCYPHPLDEVTVLWECASLGTPQTTAPFLAPNAILDFGGGVEFVGAKKRMKTIATLIG